MFAYNVFNAATAPIFTVSHFSVSKMYNFVLLPLTIYITESISSFYTTTGLAVVPRVPLELST